MDFTHYLINKGVHVAFFTVKEPKSIIHYSCVFVVASWLTWFLCKFRYSPGNKFQYKATTLNYCFYIITNEVYLYIVETWTRRTGEATKGRTFGRRKIQEISAGHAGGQSSNDWKTSISSSSGTLRLSLPNRKRLTGHFKKFTLANVPIILFV